MAPLKVAPDSPTFFELFCCFRLIRILNRLTPRFTLTPIDGENEALAHLESDDTRIEIHHDSTGNLSFHEPLDTTHRPAHAQYARYHNAIIDYSTTLESLTGNPHNPVLYNGRPDIIIEIYDTTTDEQLDSVLLGEIKHSNATQTFKKASKNSSPTGNSPTTTATSSTTRRSPSQAFSSQMVSPHQARATKSPTSTEQTSQTQPNSNTQTGFHLPYDAP